VGCGGECLEVLLGEFGIGDGEEVGVPLCVLLEVAEAEDVGWKWGGVSRQGAGGGGVWTG